MARPTALWVALSALLVGCGGGAATTDEPLDDQAVSAEVEAVLETYLAAVSERDTATIRSLYLDDGRFVWMESGAVQYRSADQVLEGLSAFPEGTPIETSVQDLKIVPVGGSGAHAWAAFSTTIGTGDQSFTFGGMMSFVLERSDGVWRIVGGHTSSPQPGR